VLRILKVIVIAVALFAINEGVAAQNTLKRVVLEGSTAKNIGIDNQFVLTQKDFHCKNTIYVVCKDFYLAGDITIPENCTLEFDGGSVSNGVLKCNGTYLQGRIQLENTVLKGSIENGRIESEWYGLVPSMDTNIDNSGKIANLIASCENTKKDLHISAGIYCTSKPVKFNADYSVFMDGELLYTGKPDVSAIYIGTDSERKGGKVFYLAVSQINYPDFTEDKNHFITSAPRNVGIELSSVYSCEFHINKVHDFVYGLVLIDDKGLGCGDNVFHIGQIINAYDGIRIIAGNDANQTCWVNDNLFIGGRIWFYKNTQLKRTAIKFERLNTKGMADNTLFLAMDLENNYSAIDFGGFATGCISLGCRFENNESPILNEGNNGNLIVGGQKYLANELTGPRTFFDYASELWQIKLNKVILDLPQINYAYDGTNVSTANIRISDRMSYKEVGEHALPLGVRSDDELNINHTRLFIDIDVSKVKMLKIETMGLWRAMMDFYDNKGNKIKPFEKYREHLYFYDYNIDGWYNDAGVFAVAHKMTNHEPLELFIKDDGITKIRFYIFGDPTLGECWIKSLRITADEYTVVENDNKLFHLSTRPVKIRGVDMVSKEANPNLKPGVIYFYNGKPVFWNGNEWVDALGNIVK